MDLAKLIQKVIQNKSLFFVVVVVLAFSVAGVVLWGGFNSKMVFYQNQIRQKKEKNTIILEYNKVKKQLDEYLSSLSKPLTSEALISKIASYASQSHIDIVDINPQGTKKFDNYVSIIINLSITAKDFRDIVSFIRLLETSPYSFKIQNWKGKMPDSEAGVTACDLNIVSVQVKK